jgi:hypothetical protein
MAPSASAASVNGWIGPTPVVNGNSYLHYSTISNTPLFADTRIYTSFGYAVPAYTMGVRSRLFKSGALCVINPVKYNATSTGSLTGPTSGDCGPGSYNSHGFVLVDDGTDYQEFVTFPTNPLDWGGAAAAPASAAQEIQQNSRGETFGSAESITDDADLPDLILSIGTNGQTGYIKSSDIPATPATKAQAASLPESTDSSGQRVRTTSAKTVPLYESDGTTVVGQFRIG